MGELVKIKAGGKCRYCARTTKYVQLLTAPPGQLPTEALFKKPGNVAIVCDYCDQYSAMPTQEAA